MTKKDKALIQKANKEDKTFRKINKLSARVKFLTRHNWYFKKSPIPGLTELHGPGYILTRKGKMRCIDDAIQFERNLEK